MSTDSLQSLYKEISRYLVADDPRAAYTLLYIHLQDADDNGTTYYSKAELRFDEDPELGPHKRIVSDPDTASFLEDKKQEFESALYIATEGQAFNKVKDTNPLLLLIILDMMLRSDVELSSFPQTGSYTINGISYFLLTRQYDTNNYIKAARQSGDLKLIVRWNHVIRARYNKHEIVVHALDPDVCSDLQTIIDEGKSVNIYSAESHRVDYRWRASETSKRFVFEGYNCDSEPKKIMDALESANSQNAQIVIFPELSVSEALRAKMKTWLSTEHHSLLLVIAGSWHVPEQENSDDIVNESIIFDKFGHTVCKHRKTTVFSFKKSQAQKYLYHEGIVTGNRLNLLMTPIGLASLLICKDFCDLLSDLREPLKNCSPDLIFLPTMGDGTTMSAHDKAYNDLNVSFIPTLICSNQTPLMSPSEDDVPGRAYCGAHTIKLSNNISISPEGRPTKAPQIAQDFSNDVTCSESTGKIKKTAPYLTVPDDKLFALKLRKNPARATKLL